MAGRPSGYEFGDIRVDTTSARVFRSGKPVLLEPKAFELLVYLARNPGRLIEKQEFLDALWADTFVSDNAMTRVVAQLRKALGDNAHGPRYIETVPRRGYRFVADVRPVPTAHERSLRTKKLAVLIVGASAALLLMSFVLLTPGREDTAPTARPVQITSSAALDIFPAMSPDGNAVAFSSNRGGTFEIYVKQLAPGGEVLQLTSDGSQNFQPAWSPDGELIAYHSKNRGGIWTVPAFGGASRRLADFGSRPAWSPDGEWIAFESEPLTDLGSNARVPVASTVWLCGRNGEAPHQLTQPGEPDGGHGSPTWSPEGDRVAFLARGRIWAITREGKAELLDVPSRGLSIYDIVYAASGDALFISALDFGPPEFHGQKYGLWRLELDREKGSRLRQVREELSAAIRYPSDSADGKIAYASVVTGSNLASVALDPDTSEPIGPPQLLTGYTNNRNTFPKFSPDGRTIAFARDITGEYTDVWLIDADGDNARRLTTKPFIENIPSWSPDGRRVIYEAYGEGQRGWWSIDVASREESFLRPFPDHGFEGSLSPDGTTHAFNSHKDGGILNVWLLSMTDENDERRLTDDAELAGWPTWSPDGELIAFEIKRGDHFHLALIPAEGGTPVQLTNEPGLSWTGGWSPDGDKISFAAFRDDVWNVRWVSRTDQRQVQLTDYASLNTFVRYPAWSPRGDQIVYEYAETTGDIWILDP